MLILIAESKTMLPDERPVGTEEYAMSRPQCEDVAEEIMESLRRLSVDELMEQTRLSAGLARKMQKMIYEFRFKNTGNPAISAYTGVVFKTLDFDTLSPDGKKRGEENVRIISSLYGWLRPTDIVKNYRLDFTTRLEEGPSAGRALNSFWKSDVTKCLVRELEDRGCRNILNLLPGDAANCIDWKLVKKFARVWKADFTELHDGDVGKTPAAGKLKTMRGHLLRQILEENITSPEALLHTSSEHYVCEGTPRYPDHLSFIC